MPGLNAGAVSIAYTLRGAGSPLLLPDASHFFWIEKPQETAAALIRFFAPA